MHDRKGGFFERGRQLVLSLAALIAAFPLFLAAPQHVGAAQQLEDPRYILSTTTPGVAGVYHDVNFVLPADGAQLTPRDYIQIILPDFSNFFPFTEVINAVGTPQFSVSGNRLLVTNIAALPGTRIGLSGAQATNPPVGGSYGATIRITKGGINGLISHEAIVQAGASGNYVSVTAFVQSSLSAIYISGFTSPYAFVTLTNGDTAIGTSTANNLGEFSFSVSGLDPGDYTFQIVSTDGQQRQSSSVPISAFLLSGGITSITGIILSPTITVSDDEIVRGDPITISGSARPLSLVTIYTESPLRSYEITSDLDGAWSYTLPSAETESYQPGEYRARAVVQDSIGNRSLDSPTVTFRVLAPQTDPDNPPPLCDISKGDLNCDTKVNLTDFSILLSNWRTNKRRADINADGTVNLVDFSIMMSNFRK